MATFLFDDQNFVSTSDSFRAVIPRGITSQDELFKVLAQKLKLPDYFGHNWDALDEVLRDFHWLKPGQITIDHEDIPALPEKELTSYIDVLAYAVDDWHETDTYKLIVRFPKNAESRIEEIVHKIKSKR